MADDAELASLDPFAIWDAEVVRLEGHFAALAPEQWARPSRCEGWSVRDVLAHLTSSEDYNRACLDGTVGAFLADLGARGVTDLDSANALGVADLADPSPAELLAAWHEACAENRRRFRDRADGTVDTSVGAYPSRWQAFHLAAEAATHADDVDIVVAPDDEPARRGWRARFSRFALSEVKPDFVIELAGSRTRIRGEGVDVELDDHALVAAVAGRLGADSGIDESTRRQLSAT